MRKYCTMLAATTLIISMCMINTSCVDEAYDLTKDIDLTIQFGGSEFAIPGGATEPIKLGDVLEINEGDLIKVDKEGNYYLYQEGNKTQSEAIRVDAVNIPSPVINPIKVDLKVDVPSVTPPIDLAIPEFDVLPGTYKTNYNLTKSNMPKELQDISFIKANTKVNLNLSFSSSLSVKKLLIKDFSIKFPSHLHIKEAVNNIYKITAQEITATGVNIPLTIEGIDCKGSLNSDTHMFNLNGCIEVFGKVQVPDQVKWNGENVQVVFSIGIDINNINIESATGIIKPDVNVNINPVSIDNLPDFINDNEVELDLHNPMVFLDIENITPLKATIFGTMRPFKQGNATHNEPIKFNIPIKRDLAQHFCLSPLKEGFDSNIYQHIQLEDLANIINPIPDEIRFDVDVKTSDEETTVNLDKNYYLGTNYNVYVPFQLGPNLSIVYKDTLNGWIEELSDLSEYDVKLIQLTGCVENNVPLKIKLEAIPLDERGNVLQDITTKVSVKESADGFISAGKSNLIIDITSKKENAVMKLDGLALRAHAVAGQDNRGKHLNENQTVQLTDIRLKVPGGIKVNLN